MPSKLFLATLLALSMGCGPRFKPSYERSFNCFDHPQSIPIIVVARIEPNAVRAAGKPFTDDSIPFGPIQLLKVKVSIENVLKGSAPLGAVDLFHFSIAGGYVGPKIRGFYETRAVREMLLLRQEQGKLRLFKDVSADCSASVYSGAHLRSKPRPGEPVPERMIDLLLTPGAGATDLGMVRAIFEWEPVEISPDYTAKVLLGLAASEPPVVRAAACLEFRDILAERLTTSPLLGMSHAEEATLSEQFGVSRSELERWREQHEQNGWARN